MEEITPNTPNKKPSFRLKRIWLWILRHKLSFLIIVFAVHITFFDKNNLVRRLKQHYEIIELKREIIEYKEEYEKSTKLLDELNSNPEKIEKIAREKYFMKKEDEDIYIFED